MWNVRASVFYTMNVDRDLFSEIKSSSIKASWRQLQLTAFLTLKLISLLSRFGVRAAKWTYIKIWWGQRVCSEIWWCVCSLPPHSHPFVQMNNRESWAKQIKDQHRHWRPSLKPLHWVTHFNSSPGVVGQEVDGWRQARLHRVAQQEVQLAGIDLFIHEQDLKWR